MNQSGTIEQASDYYPYGLAFNYNNLDKNRYLYNGKELQNQTLATTFFGVYDYGARHYDPTLGRWHCIDNKIEKYYNFSPYMYSANNPITIIDPNEEDLIKVIVPANANASKTKTILVDSKSAAQFSKFALGMNSKYGLVINSDFRSKS